MASTRLIWLAGVAFFLFGGRTCPASGGDYDAVPLALDYYLLRMPAKSITQIYADLGQTEPNGNPIKLPREKLFHDFAAGASPQLVAEIDDLLLKSRSPYAGATQINLLHDLRDLAQNSQATGTELCAYVLWRFDHQALFEKVDDDGPPLPPNSFDQISAQAAKASKAMQPYWLYLEGAFYYKSGDDTKSEPYFDRILTDYPDSPRAEAALFMQARCKLSQSVAQGSDGVNGDAAKIAEAKALFQSYLTKYPHGRYVSDVTGWLGGVAYRTDDPGTAIAYYTQQLEMKDHPENFGSALAMIEKILARSRPEDDTTLDTVARHPPVALALAYLALNFTQPKDGNDDQDYEAYNRWRHLALFKLGQAVLTHKDLYSGAAWQDRYLAILAHAASDGGDQKQALGLLALGGKSGAPHDDFLYAKALVLQRDKQLAPAEAAYRELLAKYPKSALARGARYRLALALHDQKRDGDALLELAALRGNHLTLRPYPTPDAATEAAEASQSFCSDSNSAVGIDYSGAPDEQVAETIDTILNFAPLPELEKAYAATAGAGRAQLHADLALVLQERYLDHDDFQQAARFTDLAQVKKQWSDLAQKSAALANATGPDSARGCMEMADFWVANRKMLPAMPLDSLDARGGLSYGPEAETFRTTNAGLLAYAKPEDELESREGLWHAVKWWGKASATHDPTAAPTALWSIIQARRLIAEVNPYTWQRALDGGAGADSKADYDLIVHNYPSSPEALHEAVYWTFAGGYPRKDFEHFTMGYDRDGLSADWLSALKVAADNGQDAWNAEEGIKNALSQLAANISSENTQLFIHDAKAFRDFVGNQPSIDEADWVNCAEDLVAFSQIDGVAPAVRAAYVKARGQLLFNGYYDQPVETPVDLDALRQQPTAGKVADFIDFLDIARTAHSEVEVPVKDLDKDGQPLTFTSRDYQGLLTKTTAFLDKYPQSPKREAARLLQLRALIRLSRPREVSWTIDWPAANQWDDEYAPRFLTLAPFDAARTAAAFKAYDDEFPNGHYVNAVLALRADADLIQKHWGDALDHLSALLAQQSAPELHTGAAGELAYIFDQLDHNDRREEVLAEIMKRPAMRDDLASYLSTGNLAPLKDYLTAKLAQQ
jgi:TolA-binding protein